MKILITPSILLDMEASIETAYENYISPLAEKTHKYNEETDSWEDINIVDAERTLLTLPEDLVNDRYNIMKHCPFANLDEYFAFFEDYHCEILKSSPMRTGALQMLEDIIHHYTTNPTELQPHEFEGGQPQKPITFYFLVQNNRVEQMVWALKHVSDNLPFLSTIVCDSFDTLDYSEFDYIISEELFFQQPYFQTKMLGAKLEDFFE